MIKYSLISILSILILLISISSASAQGGSSEYSAYSQYYTMPSGTYTQGHITTPEKYDIQNKQPNDLYFAGQKQSTSYSQYQNYNTYMGGYSLWIQGATSWTQYAVVPKGSYLSLVAITPNGGNGYLYEVSSDGQCKKYNYYFYPGYNLIKYYPDNTGQYMLFYSIDYYVSNVIVIKAVNYYPPYQQQNYQQQNYQQQNYQQQNYQQQNYQQPGYLQLGNQQTGYQQSGNQQSGNSY